jgi:thioredoxin 1
MAADTFLFNDENFSEATASGVSLVDLYADWCGPCKIMAPAIDKLATAYVEKAKVGKLNVDDSQLTAGKMGVTSIPTVIIFKDGAEIDRFVGVQSEENLARAIDKHLA